jgi:nitroreductase
VHDIYHRDWINSSPCVIIICGDKTKSWKRKEDSKDHLDIDIAITIDHMTLAATEQELATCWVCNFHVEKCKEVLNLPEHMEPIALLPIGYPADKPDTERHKTKRKSLDEIVHWEL